jgi:DNA repair protein RadC
MCSIDALMLTCLRSNKPLYILRPSQDRAAGVIVAHNHPSGDPRPSREDIKTTQQLAAAGVLLGIPVRDHIIVAVQGHYSFIREGLV